MCSSARQIVRCVLAGLLIVRAGTAVAESLRLWNNDTQVEPGGYLDGLAIVDTGGGRRQWPQALADAWLDAAGPNGWRGRLELRGEVGGPFEGAHAGGFNFVHAFQNLSPSLDLSQAYVELRLRDGNFKIGVQTFAWGKLDGIPPTDVINPRSYHDPIVEDFEEAKVGIPALQGTYYLPDTMFPPSLEFSQLRATLVYVPLAVPSQLPLTKERWFPSGGVPSQVTVKVGGTPRRVVVTLGTSNHAPAKTFDGGGVAFRLQGVAAETDWDIYYYGGPYTGPNGDLVLSNLTYDPHRHVDAVLRQKTSVIHMAGADWAATLAGATVRAEAAVFLDRPYLADTRALANKQADRLNTDLMSPNGRASLDIFPEIDSAEWGIGIDYLYHGFLPLLQLSQIILLDSAPRLLIANPETTVTAVLRKSFWRDRLELDFRGVYGVVRGGWFAFPRVSYLLRDDLRIRLGYLAIGGPIDSLVGQFQRNDEVVFQVRYSF